MYIQNLTTIGPVVSEIMWLIKIDTDDRQTGGNGRPLFAYSRGRISCKIMKLPIRADVSINVGRHLNLFVMVSPIYNI